MILGSLEHCGLVQQHDACLISMRQRCDSSTRYHITLIDADIQSRFWSKVQKTDTCWNWIAGGRGNGYGSFRLSGKTIDAHVVSWMIHYGNPTLCVLHKCDNRKCINPSHLFEGTHKDNHDDMVAKGRKTLPRKGRVAPIRHGTIDEYRTFGCRCDDCKIAQRNRQREYRKRRKDVDNP